MSFIEHNFNILVNFIQFKVYKINIQVYDIIKKLELSLF